MHDLLQDPALENGVEVGLGGCEVDAVDYKAGSRCLRALASGQDAGLWCDTR
ncbi:MAG: hypothetical protein ACP5JG_18445 [Anaerolineae bacterium]